MYFLLQATEPSNVTKVVEPALSTLDKSVIGALLVVSWALATLAIWQLIKVQNARVADQQVMNTKSEALMEKMLTAFGDMKGALEALKKSEEETVRLTEAVKNSISAVSSRLDFITYTVSGKGFTPTGGKRTSEGHGGDF